VGVTPPGFDEDVPQERPLPDAGTLEVVIDTTAYRNEPFFSPSATSVRTRFTGPTLTYVTVREFDAEACDCPGSIRSCGPVHRSPLGTIGAMQTTYCTFEHRRSVPAVVRVWVKSAKVGKPGHPMSRELRLCARHATELRRLGVELVDA
jgi:hypothetical protein